MDLKGIAMNENDPIQAAVETCIDEIQQIFISHPPSFLAVHFLCGEHEKPGFIRKSALRLGDQFIEDLGIDFITKAENEERKKYNSDALKRHVREFERKNTLLKLALDKMNKHGQTGFMFRVGNKIEDSIKHYLSQQGWGSDELTWPDGIGEFLVPHDKALDYLQRLYSNKPLCDFDMQRAEAFGRWVSANSNEKKEDIWRYINPLQSSLIYFSVAHRQNSNFVGGDFLVFKLSNDITDGQNIYPYIVIVLSPALNFSVSFEKMQVAICNAFAGRAVVSHLGEQSRHSDMKQSMLNALMLSEEKNRLVEVLEKESAILPIPGHSQRLMILTLWLSILGKKLSAEVHEGKSLEFWFVAGDLSEFEDDPDIIFEKHFDSIDQREIFSPPSKLSELENHASLAAKLLAKEHFPWFEDGRYALFFDLANEHMHAVGLCGVKHSTWSYIYSDVYKSAQEQCQKHGIAIPMCLISYVSKRHGGNGIAICNPNVKKGKKKLKQLMRLVRGAWQTAEDQRQKKLLALFQGIQKKRLSKRRLTEIQNDSLKSLAELCIMLADNPQAGGTVVLMKDNDLSKMFLQMGKPWKFGEGLSVSEEASLMAHDGATLVYVNAKELVFNYRYILSSDGIEDSIRSNLRKVSEEFYKNSPLAGVGTRRWSAVLAAFMPDVDAVIVISQDGDITCWECPDWASAKYTDLPLGGKPITKILSKLR